MPFAPFTPTASARVAAARPSHQPGRSLDYPSAEAGPSSRPAAAPGAIQAIPRSDVHRITSGQVVLDLQGAVKELVENALDAGASNIEVRFRDYGAEAIEVVDNGSGIAPENYAGVALKHHTSKLSSFDDLAGVRTFGFRGEALSSLCALGKVQIITATKEDAPMGTVLELGPDGQVSSSDGKAARQRGTTVVVEGLFHSLPVRRREFEKNLKREYGKAQALLQAYALISKGVRWSASNTPKGGRKAASLSVVSASGPKYLGANATALFGPRVANTLDPFELTLELPRARARVAQTQPRPPKRRRLNAASSDAGTDSDDERDAVPADDAAEESDSEPGESFRVSGLISRPEHGCGRSSTDKLFLYLNGRPWDNTRLTRAFAEVYRTFTGQQPMVVADFHIDGNRYDVNVSPDKRTMLVHDEAAIVEQLKIQLEALFSPSRGTFAIAGALGAPSRAAAQSKLAFAATTKSYAALVRPQEDASAAAASDAEMEEAGEAQAETPAPASPAPPSPTLGASRARADSAASNESASDPSSDLPTASALWRSVVRPVRPEGGSVAAPHCAVAALEQPTSEQGDDEAQAPPSPGSSQPDVVMASEPRRASSPPNEPVLDTTRASWSPVRRTVRADDAPSRRDNLAAGRAKSPITQVRLTAPSVSSAALRSQLADSLRGFARPGTQVGALHAEATEAELEYRESMPPSSEDDEEHAEAAAAPNAASEQQQVTEEILAVDVDEDEDAAERGRHLAALEEAAEQPAVPTAARAWRDEMPNVDAASAEDETPLPFDLDVLRARVQSKARRLANVRARDAASERDAAKRITGAGIAAQDAGQVERELSRVISKRDFTSMTVAGQFNLGFIIARRRPAMTDADTTDGDLAGQMDDLFIVDQHAADEKYNFEMLQRETKIRSQQLISPRTLELSPSDELVAAEHVETLRANGFDIVVDDESPPGSRVKLLSQPVSAKIVFGVRDLEELLHLLRDVAPAVAGEIRCSKVRAMHASRACRRSVMVGTALSARQMSKILLHFSTLDQPWNCPHGRPTLRHLADLRTVKTAARDSTGAQRFAQRPVDWSVLGSLS